MTSTEISVHNVISIVLGDRKLLGRDSMSPFWTREIVITNDRGESVMIQLFSHSDDEEAALKVQS